MKEKVHVDGHRDARGSGADPGRPDAPLDRAGAAGDGLAVPGRRCAAAAPPPASAGREDEQRRSVDDARDADAGGATGTAARRARRDPAVRARRSALTPPPGVPRTGPRGTDAPRGTLRRRLAAAVMAASVFLGGHAAWMPAKAALAQHLLEDAWQARVADGGAHRPWPWADTHPVARLRVPRLQLAQIVLAGDAGRPLAFGPGWAEASAPPGRPGTTIVSGHRDSHFDWLRELRDGDLVELETGRGTVAYRVASRDVVDSRTHRLAPAGDALVLVTCWPFDALAPGGPLRYVVTLHPDA